MVVGGVSGDAPVAGPVLFWSIGAVMFDLSKLNENLRAGSDRIGRILGKKTLEKVKKHAWKTLAKKDSDEDQGNCKAELRDSGRQ